MLHFNSILKNLAVACCLAGLVLSAGAPQARAYTFTLQPGLNLVANHHNFSPNNGLNTVLPPASGVPSLTAAYFWDPIGQDFAYADGFTGVTWPANWVFNPGDGAMFGSGSPAAAAVTITGPPASGSSVALVAGLLYLRGNAAANAGTTPGAFVDLVGSAPAASGTSWLFLWNATAGTYVPHRFVGGTWTPVVPAVPVGQSAFVAWFPAGLPAPNIVSARRDCDAVGEYIRVKFDREVDPILAAIPANYTISGAVVPVTSVELEYDTPSVMPVPRVRAVRLRFTVLLPAPATVTVQAPGVMGMSGTPVNAASAASFQTALVALSASFDCNGGRLCITFNQRVDPTTALNLANYSVSWIDLNTLATGTLLPTGVDYGVTNNNRGFCLRFATPLPTGNLLYTVNMTGLLGQCGAAPQLTPVLSLSLQCNPTVQGRVFRHQPTSPTLVCVQDLSLVPYGTIPFEFGLQGFTVQLSSGSGTYFAGTAANGDFSVNAPSGNYTLTVQPKPNWTQNCPVGGGGYALSIVAPNVYANNDFARSPLASINDLAVGLWANLPVNPGNPGLGRRFATPCCGFPMTLVAQYQNTGTEVILGATVTLTLPPSAAPVSAALLTTSSSPPLPPPAVAGNILTWMLPTLAPGGSGTVEATVMLNCALGSLQNILATAAITVPPGDPTPADNSAAYSQQTLCSYDPNDKTVEPPGCGPQGLVPMGTELTYFIRFQNTGSGPAWRVIIRDFLDPDLDLATVTFLGMSHVGYTSIDPITREIAWTMDNINLPGAAYDEPNSHGWVRFKVLPASGTTSGTAATNGAAIYFDLNPPIFTGSTTNTFTTTPTPVAAFIASTLTPAVQQPVNFTYTGGTVGATFEWDFGPDATPATSTAQNPTGVTYSTPGVKVPVLRVKLGGCTDSASATLTVLPDSTSPTLVSASADCGNPNKVTVVFSELLEAASAMDQFSYAISGGILIQNVVLAPDGKTVCLFIDLATPLQPGVTYTLMVQNVMDLAGNAIAPDSSITFVCPAVACIPPPSGLVAWWPLDEGTGATKYKDLAGANDALIEQGPLGSFNSPGAYPNGKVAGASWFFLSGNHGRAPNAAALNFGTGNFSVDCWFQANLGPGDLRHMAIVDKFDAGTGRGYRVSINQGQLELRLGGTIGVPTTYTCTLLVPGSAWVFIGVAVDRTPGIDVVRFQVDGLVQTQNLASHGNIDSTIDLLIGEPISGHTDHLLDEVEMFDSALTTAQFDLIRNAGSAGKCKPPCERQFADSTFIDSDWTLTVLPCPSGSSSLGVQDPSGGGCTPDNGPYRRITTILSGGNPGVIGVHLRNGATHDPSSQGGLGTLDYSECNILFSGGGGGSAGQATGPALKQGGNYYILSLAKQGTTPQATWAPFALSGLTATDFHLVDCSKPGFRDSTQHPNFCTGSIIEFGFFRGRSTSGAETTIGGIDNWRVQLHCGPCCVPPPANMVLWLPFDENGLTAKNLAGGNNGTHVNGPAFNSGSYVLNSRCFDGVNDQVNVVSYPAIEFGQGDFSVDAWVKVGSDNSFRTIVEHRLVSSSGPLTVKGYSFLLWPGNTLAFQIGDGAPSNWLNINSTVTVPADGQWHFVAATVDRTSKVVTFHRDGWSQTQPIPPNISGSVTPPSGTPLLVGGSAGGFFKGCIDEVELFNRELTAAEVKALWKAGSAGKCKPVCIPKPANNVLWLALDELTGTTAYNLAAFYLPGILNGTHIGGPTPNPNSFVFNSLCFDGVDDQVKVPSHPALGFGMGNFSVDAWVKVDPAGNNSFRTIVEHREVVGPMFNPTSVRGYGLFLWPGNNIGFQMGVGGFNWQNFTSSFTVPADGRWHLVAVTVERSSPTGIKFYLDGNLDPATATPYLGNVTLPPGNPLSVGASPFASSFFKGCIDEVELFGRALAPAEIKALYDARSAGKCKPNPHPIPFPIMRPPQRRGNTLTLSWFNVSPGQRVEVEATTNFIDWTVVASPPDGTNEVELPVNPGQTRLFYRLRGSVIP